MFDKTFSFYEAVEFLKSGRKVARKALVGVLYFKRVQFNGFAPCYIAYYVDASAPDPGIGFTVEDVEAIDWYLVD